MVTPLCEGTPPIVTRIGTAAPGVTLAGTTALICSSPAIDPPADLCVADL